MSDETKPAHEGGEGGHPRPHTLVIDVGGTGTKMIRVDAAGDPIGERARRLTPKPCTPGALLTLLDEMIAEQPSFERISVGFPGIVKRGVTYSAPNLGDEAWRGVDLAAALTERAGRPTRVLNDAELQGFGVIEGVGVEMVLTLGTGLGAGLYTGGRLVPNLELGHHPFEEGQTYEERVGEAARKEIGKKRWNKRVAAALAQLAPIFNYDRLYLGGGNAKKLSFELPDGVQTFTNVEGLRGGVRLWDEG